MSIVAIAEGIKKAGSTDSDKVSKALLGLTFDTPVGKRTINEKTHETEAGEFWSEMVKDPKVPFAVMKKPDYIDPEPYCNSSPDEPCSSYRRRPASAFQPPRERRAKRACYRRSPASEAQ